MDAVEGMPAQIDQDASQEEQGLLKGLTQIIQDGTGEITPITLSVAPDDVNIPIQIEGPMFAWGKQHLVISSII